MTEKEYTLQQIADYIDALRIEGDPNLTITGISTLTDASSGDISFLNNPKYRTQLSQTRASAVILAPSDADDCQLPAIVMKNAYLGYAKAAELFDSRKKMDKGISPNAKIGKNCHISPEAVIKAGVVIGDNCRIGADTIIASGVVVGDDCKIGTHCHLYANVTLYDNTTLGDRVTIHSGTVIGSDGFGYAQSDQGVWYKIPQLGQVIIYNDVEIGANCTIDRGAVADTIIGDGVKLDNQIQIGHNVIIGEHTAIAGCVGIAGSSRIGRHCRIGGGACIGGHLEICDHAAVTGMSMITRSISSPGVYSSGTGMLHNRAWKKNAVRFRQLDSMARRLEKLEHLLLKEDVGVHDGNS